MSFSVGIVGLPNVGKSTLFAAITKRQVDCANYPFCTIEPNVGTVAVPDERLEKLAVQEHSKKVTPTVIEFVDIAGLVAGAAKGEGLGNKFLSHIREVDAIAHVIRDFKDENTVHVSGSVDPLRDADVINLELTLADLETVEKRLRPLEKTAKSGDALAKKQLAALEKVKALLEQGKAAREAVLDEDEAPAIAELHLLTSKPMLYVLNTDEAADSAQLPDTINGLPVVALSVKLEAELAGLSKQEREELGYKDSGLDRLIAACYTLLNLETYLTAGEQESRAWTITRGTKAPQAAGKIHTDFERGFIKAEIINWQKLLEAGSYPAARDKGWIRQEGKDYVMQDGDVVEFKFNV